MLGVLFVDFDDDQDGRVSLAEFQAGLQMVRPWVTGLDVIEGFVRSIGLKKLVVGHLASADEKELPIDIDAIAAHLNPGDMQAAWHKGLADKFTLSFHKLRLL